MKKFILYFLIYHGYSYYCQTLWLSNIGSAQWYVPYDNNALIGAKFGFGTITKKRFLLQFSVGYFHNSKNDSIQRIDNTIYYISRVGGKSYSRPVFKVGKISNAISYINLLYGFTTNPFHKISFSFMSGISFTNYPDSPFIETTGIFPYSINFFNISSQIRIRLKENLYLYNILLLRTLKHSSIQNEIGIIFLLNKQNKLSNIQFNDTSQKFSSGFDIGIGTSYNFLQYYYYNYYYYNFSPNGWENKIFGFQTIDIHSELYFKGFLIKYLAKIYTYSYNPSFEISGGTPIMNNICIGYSSKYNNKDIFFSIGAGSYISDNFYYKITTDANQIKLYDRNRLLFSSFIELGHRLKKNVYLSVYLNRIGNYPFESSEPQALGSPYWIDYPKNTHTSFGISLSYVINKNTKP